MSTFTASKSAGLSRRQWASLAGAGLFRASSPPNVVLINCDDLGYGDVGCYGSPLSTPNIDNLARTGVRFTHFTSANPVCSPSRAAMLTGRYPTRVGIERVLFPDDKTGLPDDEPTLAAVLKSRGYRTMCVGKWHLGHLPEFLPTRRGFDRYYGIPYSNDMAPPVVLRDSKVVAERADMQAITSQYTDESVKFLEEDTASPFFLYLAHTMPHIPLGVSPRFRGKSPFGLYGDVVAEIDWSLGELQRSLRRTGRARNTLIVFTSDNGPWFEGSPGKLRGRKGMVYEGGVRVPFVASLPGQIQPGRVCGELASSMDLMPTLARLAGATLPAKRLDGIDIWPLLTGAQRSLDRDVLLYFDGWNLQCARLGKWKLHFARYNSAAWSPVPSGGRRSVRLMRPELFDVVADSDESFDVSGQHPEIVARILGRVESMLLGFPEPVRQHWAAQQAGANTETRTGALPSH